MSLQMQLISGGGGSSGANTTANILTSEAYLELQADNGNLFKALQLSVEQNTAMAEKLLCAEMNSERLKTKLEQLQARVGTSIEALNTTFEKNLELGEGTDLAKPQEMATVGQDAEAQRAVG